MLGPSAGVVQSAHEAHPTLRHFSNCLSPSASSLSRPFGTASRKSRIRSS